MASNSFLLCPHASCSPFIWCIECRHECFLANHGTFLSLLNLTSKQIGPNNTNWWMTDGPCLVFVNIYLRSISKISDLDMVSGLVCLLFHSLFCFSRRRCQEFFVQNALFISRYFYPIFQRTSDYVQYSFSFWYWRSDNISPLSIDVTVQVNQLMCIVHIWTVCQLRYQSFHEKRVLLMNPDCLRLNLWENS